MTSSRPLLALSFLAACNLPGASDGPGSGAVEPGTSEVDATVHADQLEQVTGVRIREVGPSNVIATAINIRIAGEVFADGQIGGEPPESTKVVIAPEIAGSWTVTTRDGMTFSPEVGFAPATAYTVTLERVGNPEDLRTPPEAGAWRREFTTPAFGVVRMSLREREPAANRITAELVFSGPVDVEDVASKTTFTLGGEAVRPTLHRAADARHAVRFVFAGRDFFEERALVATVAAGVTLTTAPTVAASAGTAKVDLAAGQAMDIRAVFVKEGANGHYIDIVCHDEAGGDERYYYDRETWDGWYVSERCQVSAEEAALGIRFDPGVDFTVAPGPVGFRVFGDFERGDGAMTIDAGIRTVDGGMLGSTFEHAFSVPARSPKVSFTAKGRYLPRSAWTDLAIRHVNVDQVEVAIRHVPEQNLVFWMSGEEPATERNSAVVAKKTLAVRNTPDEEVTTWLDVDALVPDAAKGVYEVHLRGVQAGDEQQEEADDTAAVDTGWWRHDVEEDADEGPTDSSRLLLTDMQLIAKLSAADREGGWAPSAQVWAADIHSGEPVSGASVKVVRPSGQVLGSCRTDFGGSCTAAIAQDVLDDTPPMAILVGHGDDLTYVRFADLQVPPPSDTHGVPYLDDKPYRAAVYTDRGVYRPGDTAHVSAIVREADHSAPRANLPVVAKLFDPKRKELRRKVLQTNPAGLVSTDLAFADFATTGPYRVVFEVGEAEIGVAEFAVEEFVPERMKVEAEILGEHLASDQVPVGVDARWLFGGSAEGSEVELTCQLVPGGFVPEQNQGYHYGLSDIEDGMERRVVALGALTDKLDADGHADLRCPAATRSGGFLGAATLVAQAAVFEGDSGRTTLGEASAPVHPERYYVGLSSTVAKARGGEALPVSGITVDWAGAPSTAASSVTLDLVRLEEEYLWTWDESDSRYRYRRMLRRAQEDTIEVPVSGGKFIASVRPAADAAGYLVVAKAGNARTELYIEGSGRRYWWQSREATVDATPRPAKPGELQIDAPQVVQVGDRVTVTTNAPYAGRVLWTAETHQVIDSYWQDVAPGEIEWSFKAREFVPNVYVSALLIKDPHLESAEAFLPDRAFGVRSIEVQPTKYTHDLKLTVPAEVRPYAPLSVGIDLGPQSETTYVTVAAVDEGILSLTDFESPDPFDTIFARRELGVSTYETVGWTLLVPPGGPSSHTGGGAGGEGGGRVQMVKPVALWSGVVEVPQTGKANVTFDVPGYRGELRVMAVSTGSERMGHASAPVTVRDPIVLQTTLPRFLVEGDEATLPVYVSNVSGLPRDIAVTLTTEDLALPSDGAVTQLGEQAPPVVVVGDATARLTLADGASDTVLFRVRAQRAPDAAKFLVTAKAGKLTSKEEIELPVARPESESRDTVKVSLSKGANELSPSFAGWIDGTDRTRIWVTTNPFGEALSHVRALVRYPYGCVEQTTSSTRPLLYVSTLLDAIDPELAAEHPVDKMVRHGVERVLSMQTPGGGFAYWPGGYAPNAWGTAYATHMLLDAKKAGFVVPQRPLDDALGYLEREATSRVGTYDGDYTTAYIHYVLALAGRARTAQVEGLLAQVPQSTRGSSSYRQLAEPRYLLMAAMYLGGDRRYEADLRKPDTTSLTAERANSWAFWSDLRSRGFQLSVYHDLFGSSGAEGEQLAGIVGQGLANQRSSWYTTQEMAWGLTGLGKWVGGGMSDIGQPTLTIDGRAIEAQAISSKGGADYVWTVAGATAAGSVRIDLSKTGGKTVYAVISTEGVRTQGAPTGGNGLALTRQMYTGDGSPVDASNHQLGDPVYVKLSIRNTSGSDVQNIALVDRIPAGWEIENPRLGRGYEVDWYDPSTSWDVEHMNLRDDRVEVFGTLPRGETRYVLYQVRAVTAGTFTHPSVSAEAMYDPRLWARLPKSRITVLDPWGGS